MTSPPSRRLFRYFYLSFVVSLLGDSFRLLAVNVWIFEASDGSPGQRLVLVLLGNLPGLLLGGLSGVLADRWDKYRILVASDLLRMVVAFGLAWCASESRTYPALALLAAGNALGVFFTSSAFSLLPRLVEGDRLAKTNGVMESSQWVVQIVGPSLAAAALAFAGAPTAFLVDGASFLMSAVLLSALGRSLSAPTAAASSDNGSGPDAEVVPQSSDEVAAGAARSHWESFAEGVALIWRTDAIRSLLLASYGVTFMTACTTFSLIFVVANSLHKNAATLGLLYSLNGLVAVVAAIATTTFIKDAQLGRVMALAMLGLSVAQVVMGVSPNVWVLGIGIVISAVSNAPYNVSVTTLYMTRIPAEFLGRVEGVDTMVDNAVRIAAFAFSLIVVSMADARTVFVFSAVVALPSLILAGRRLAARTGETSPTAAM